MKLPDGGPCHVTNTQVRKCKSQGGLNRGGRSLLRAWASRAKRGAGSGSLDPEEDKQGKVRPESVLGEELLALAIHPQPCALEGLTGAQRCQNLPRRKHESRQWRTDHLDLEPKDGEFQSSGLHSTPHTLSSQSPVTKLNAYISLASHLFCVPLSLLLSLAPLSKPFQSM